MPTDNPFPDFLRRIRAGDQEAAAELFRQYEPLICREVRLHLTDPRLNRLFDSMDVCQSVLHSFFLRAAAGQYDLESPGDLHRLLLTMARNKVISKVRKLRRAVEVDGQALAAPELEAIVDHHPPPDQVAAGRDLLRRVLHLLTAEERRLAELRGQGLTWPEVAAAAAGTPEGRRKQLRRALDRVLRHLGLEDEQLLMSD